MVTFDFSMKKLNLPSFVFESSEKELSFSDKKLLSEAQKSAKCAYAPYSNFKVGTAVLLENGKIISGNNQENAAYPSGLCAERVALFYAIAQFPNAKIRAIAITSVPCGSCRQAILEYERKQKSPVRIIMQKDLPAGKAGKNKTSGEPSRTIFISEGISNLLPLAFDSKELKKV